MTPPSDHSNSQGSAAVTEFYDVFVNFRGADTRAEFVSVLRRDLSSARGNIVQFYDDESMHCGDEISQRLKQGIRNSQMYICVFSKNYANSKWCLRELKQMNDERKKHGKRILPIFYNVEVDDVKLKDGSCYLQQLLEAHPTVEPGIVDLWRDALKEVAGLKGHKMSNSGGDLAMLSKTVVSDVTRLLMTRPLGYFLVGMEEKVPAVVDMLDVDSCDVQLLIIHGESGIGKTTLAREVFNRLRGTCFENCSFVEDIVGSQLHRPQPSSYTYFMKKVLEDIRGEELNHLSPIIGREELKKHFRESFRNKKVLIVLDNVTNERDITELKSVWFGPGSRIIVTTEVTRCLALAQDSTIKIMNMKVDGFKVKSFKMQEMTHKQALQLFSRHAFREDSPPEEFKIVSRKLVSRTQELPLTLEIIGAFLHRKSKEVFTKTEKELLDIKSSSKTREDKVKQVLRISYDALKEEAKDIFLDIACFFVNKEKNRAMHMWETTYLASTVEDLTRVSLVKIVDNEKMWMHDQLREMGRDIVKKDEEPNRLWEHKKALAVLESKEVSHIVQALRICTDESLVGSLFGPLRMKRLRFLQLYSGHAAGEMEGLNELRWLSWRCCADSLNADIFAEDLLILDLSFSSMTNEWSGWNKLKKKAFYLRVLDLKGCKELTTTPSLCAYNELERLILEDCQNLKTLDSSICALKKLKYLNLKGCDSLQELPEEIGKLGELVELVITKRKRGSLVLPESIGILKSLQILEINNVKFADPPLPIPVEGQETLTRLSLFKCSSVNFEKLPESLGSLTSLVELDISSTNFVKFPDSMKSLKQLKVLKMERSMIGSLPSGIEELKSLEELHAKHSKLEGEVPDGICKLPKLRILDLSFTNVSYLRPKLPGNLECLRLTFWSPGVCASPNCNERIWMCNLGCVSIDDLCRRMSLVNLEVKDAFSLDWIGKLTKLERLELTVPSRTDLELGSQNFSFPDQLKSLKLSSKELSWCSKLPSDLSTLSLIHVEVVPEDFQSLLNSTKVSSLSLYSYLGGSLKFDDVPSLLHFSASRCDFGMELQERHLPVHLQVLCLKDCKFPQDSVLNLSLLTCLKQLEIVGCDGLVEIKGIGQLRKLQKLYIGKCNSLERFGDWELIKAFKRDETPNCSFSCHIILPKLQLYFWNQVK